MQTDAECKCENPDRCARCQHEAAEHFAEQEAKELLLGREAGRRVMAQIEEYRADAQAEKRQDYLDWLDAGSPEREPEWGEEP